MEDAMDRGEKRGGDREAGAGSRRDGGFGDDQGTRVGRPDPDEGKAAPSSDTGGANAIEGSILEGEESVRGMTANDRQTPGGERSGGGASSSGRGSTGAGSEAAEGVHSAPGRSPSEKSGVDNARNEPSSGNATGRSGSEPLEHRETEHKSGYGGEGSEPKTSSDQR